MTPNNYFDIQNIGKTKNSLEIQFFWREPPSVCLAAPTGWSAPNGNKRSFIAAPLFLSPARREASRCGSPALGFVRQPPLLDPPPWSRTSARPLPTVVVVGLCLLNSCWRRPTQWAVGGRGRHSHRWAERGTAVGKP